MDGLLVRLRALSDKPRVIISHDTPQEVAEQVAVHVHRLAQGSGAVAEPPALSTSRTRAFLSAVLAIIKPELWIFGHWHTAWQGQEGSTVFRGMGFQESFVLPLPWNPISTA